MPTSIITRGSGVSIAGRRSRGLSPAFSRASAAYQSGGRKVGVGVPRFSEGRTGKAIFVEEGTTNIVPSPSFDTSAVDGGWLHWGAAGAIGSRGQTQDSEFILGEQQYAHWVANAAEATGNYLCFHSTRIAPNPLGVQTVRSFAVTLRMEDGSDVTLAKVFPVWNGRVGGAPSSLWTAIQQIGDTPFYVCRTNNIVQKGTTELNYLIGFYVKPGQRVYVSKAQIEDKAYATSFTDSVRAADRLTIPATVTEGPLTIEAWVRTNIATGFERVLFEAGDRFSVGLGADSRPTLTWTSAEGPQTASGAQTVANPTDWHHWAYSFDGVTSRVHVDGAKVIEASTEFAAAMPAEIVVATAEDRYWNGLVEDLVILLRGCSDSEIAAHMAGDIPNGCYHYLFDGDLWPAPGSLGAVVAPSVTTRPGRVDVVTRRGSVDIVTRPGKLEVIGR